LFFEGYLLVWKDFSLFILPFPLLIPQNAPFCITIRTLSKQLFPILSFSFEHHVNVSIILPYEIFDPSMILILYQATMTSSSSVNELPRIASVRGILTRKEPILF
jgi:hypothetical protein